MPAEHLLLVSLGPVQDFIASARRCQDLWFGSWLLSDLSRAVAESIRGHGTTIVFPAGMAEGESRGRAGVANLILGLLPAGAPQPQAVAEAAREAMQKRLTKAADRAWTGLREYSPWYFRRDVADMQIQEMMEFLWVAIPRTGDYPADRAALYGRLAAVKNTRLWTQPAWTTKTGAGVGKSSLDGQRESVLRKDVLKEFTAERRRRVFGLKGSEQLCGVGLLKRLGSENMDEAVPDRPPFHSTSHIAMVPTIERIRRHPQGRARFERYRDVLAELGLPTADRFAVRNGGPPNLWGLDGVLLLRSRLQDHFESEVPDFAERPKNDPVRKATLSEADTQLRALLKDTGGSIDPCPYYAFLLADGDNMGRAIDEIDAPAGHVALGQKLNDFADACAGIVAEHRGSLIFAGGDDVLALLPLHTAIQCARALHDRFDQVAAGQATLSVGLGISHSREPMADARALAKSAEKLAKAHPGKNALAIIVSKRSGADLELVGGWAEPVPLDQRLESWLEVIGAGTLSAKAAHDLDQVAGHYEGADGRSTVAEIRSLARQVIARKRASGGAKLTQEVYDKLLERVGSLDPAADVRALSFELQVARLLWTAHQDATLPVEEA